MPRAEGQKAKLLVLKQIFERKTDEEHMLSVPQLLDALEKAGMPAERKSIYSDIDALRRGGVDVELARGRGGGYYLASRTFELPELKLLVDSVQASQFITKKKSEVLIKKLESLTSDYQAGQMQRQVFVSGRVKTMNESIYYTVDTLHSAIAQDRQVTFQYLEWSLNKKKMPRKNGALYQVSPWALVWSDSKYYLIAFSEGEIRHYRVDKLREPALTDLPREGKAQFRALDSGRLHQSGVRYVRRRGGKGHPPVCQPPGGRYAGPLRHRGVAVPSDGRRTLSPDSARGRQSPVSGLGVRLRG